jgi:hypothetical protein
MSERHRETGRSKKKESDMSQHFLHKAAPDMCAMEVEIQRRLRRGKARLLISNIFFFILAVSAIMFLT